MEKKFKIVSAEFIVSIFGFIGFIYLFSLEPVFVLKNPLYLLSTVFLLFIFGKGILEGIFYSLTITDDYFILKRIFKTNKIYYDDIIEIIIKWKYIKITTNKSESIKIKAAIQEKKCIWNYFKELKNSKTHIK